MKHSDFTQGTRFKLTDRKYLCTDVGSRTVVAKCTSHIDVPVILPAHRAFRVLNGPRDRLSWAREIVLDEIDIEACEPEST